MQVGQLIEFRESCRDLNRAVSDTGKYFEEVFSEQLFVVPVVELYLFSLIFPDFYSVLVVPLLF